MTTSCIRTSVGAEVVCEQEEGMEGGSWTGVSRRRAMDSLREFTLEVKPIWTPWCLRTGRGRKVGLEQGLNSEGDAARTPRLPKGDQGKLASTKDHRFLGINLGFSLDQGSCHQQRPI